MKIAIFGASGKVGRLVTELLLAQGHELTALVHSSSPFGTESGVKIVRGDVHDIESVRETMAGCEVVVSTLGSWGTATKDIVSAATRNIVEVARDREGLRFVSVTGADARAPGDELGLLHRLTHPLLRLTAKKILEDSEVHIALLMGSNLDWTVIRSPIMKETGGRGFALGMKRPVPWATIHRHAVADAIVGQIGSNGWSKQAPYITRSK